METGKIAILGAGNLGLSIAQGLVASGMFAKNQLVLSEKSSERCQMLTGEGYTVTTDNAEAIKNVAIVMLVVKPWQIDSVLDEIKTTIDPEKQMLVSCVTGARSTQIFEQLGQQLPLFCVMPNTGIAVQESMSCISCFNASDIQKALIEKIFAQMGQVIFVGEDQMAAATALAGCGIAFALRFIRAAMEAGVEIGFGADTARIMAAQITKGAAQLLLANNSHPESEIDKVTTPKGITITGLNEMEHAGFSSAVIKGILTSYKKMDPSK